MIFGDKKTYAIELYHEPLDNFAFYMTGRMCLHLNSIPFGDIDDPACSFYITYLRLSEKMNDIEAITYDFGYEKDIDVFEFLDVKLYMADDSTTYEQIIVDAKKYQKFDFLTNGGEMFDGTKSFAYLDKNEFVHIMIQIFDQNDKIICITVEKNTFVSVTNEFVEWYKGAYSSRPVDTE